MRLTIKDVANLTGFCKKTIRKHADEGKIPHSRDLNNWRVFSAESIRAARRIAGIETGSHNTEGR